MAVAENALEPCSDANSGLFYAHAHPESHRFICLARTRRSTVIECITHTLEEVDTISVSRIQSWETCRVVRWRVVYAQYSHLGYVLDLLAPVKYAVL